jgi:hypothetical protein
MKVQGEAEVGSPCRFSAVKVMSRPLLPAGRMHRLPQLDGIPFGIGANPVANPVTAYLLQQPIQLITFGPYRAIAGE